MISLRRRECALLSLSLTLVTISCRSQGDSATNDNSATDTVVASTPPFQTKEPDRYRATRTITIVTAKGQTSTATTSVARDGDLRRHESQVESKTVVLIETPEGRFVLLPDEKIYAEAAPDTSLPTTEGDDTMESSPEGLLHAETGNTSYQKLGKESISGRSAEKYRVVVNTGGAGNVTVGETLIWIDEDLKMPVKSETKSADGTRVSMEISKITLSVDASLFKIPADYRKLTFSDFRQRLK